MPNSLTLYEAEENLLILADCDEAVPAEQRDEFERDLALAVRNAIDKRESVARFRLMLDSQIDATDAEIKRLSARKAALKNAKERLDQRVIVPAALMLPRQKDGKPAKLPAHTATISLVGNPASVDIADEAAIPSQYKTLTITIPADEWEFHIATLKAERGIERPAILDSVRKCEVSIDKRRIKSEFEAGASVPGADLRVVGNEFRVSVR